MPRKNTELLFKKQAEIAKALAHPIRVAIVDFLKDGPQCVCDIAHHIGSERSNVSRHLALMTAAGILDYHKDGLKVIYALKCPCIFDFFTCITTVIRQQANENKKLLSAITS